jgi:hypothetical protein
MTFRISALPAETFRPWFDLDEQSLRTRGGRAYTVDASPGYPCRVSLEDAVPGERVLLVPYVHLDGDTPYRASGPVFVREGARTAAPADNEVPSLLRLRALSVRAYDQDRLMTGAEIIDGRDLEQTIERLFQDERVAFLHVHFAKPGCYACRVDRGEVRR